MYVYIYVHTYVYPLEKKITHAVWILLPPKYTLEENYCLVGVKYISFRIEDVINFAGAFCKTFNNSGWQNTNFLMLK